MLQKSVHLNWPENRIPRISKRFQGITVFLLLVRGLQSSRQDVQQKDQPLAERLTETLAERLAETLAETLPYTLG